MDIFLGIIIIGILVILLFDNQQEIKRIDKIIEKLDKLKEKDNGNA